ncbi:hypothetical protein BDR04DRAFT_1153815 [Suillus decipiens]|nr:hypothetical protein BDR04DRAFT_1153815 [Suillus decipiens]
MIEDKDSDGEASVQAKSNLQSIPGEDPDSTMVCEPTLAPKNSEMPQHIRAKPVQLHIIPKDSPKKNYAWLLQLAPSLKSFLGDPRKASKLDIIIRKMDATISATHSDDTSCLKSQIGHYAAFNTKDHPIHPAIYDGSGSHTHMGINHPVLACFLCPVRELKSFSEDANK